MSGARKAKPGLAMALSAMEAGAAPGSSEAAQASLPLAVVGALGEDADGEPQALPAAGAGGAKGSPKGGRPPGSRNRRTREWVDFILARYHSPLLGLAEVAARPVADLALELGCTRLEAFDRQLTAMRELAPYLHQKLPVAVEVSPAEGVPLILALSQSMAIKAGLEQELIGEDGSMRLQMTFDGEAARASEGDEAADTAQEALAHGRAEGGDAGNQ